MGGRGAYKSGNQQRGSIFLPIILKTDIGLKRDSIKTNISNELRGKSWNKTIIENGNEFSIKIQIKRNGIKHITNDIHKLNVIKQGDIHKLSNQIKNSSFIKSSPLKHSRKDNFNRFYYFKAQKSNLYFNVGRKTNSNGSIIYELYSITKKI